MYDFPGRDAALRLLSHARARVHAVLHPGDVERAMRAEFQHHLAARADALVRDEGLTPAAARRRAWAEFGDEEHHAAQAREATGTTSAARLRVSWLDVRLGLRMLPKHPVLNLAAIFALAVGIPVGLAPSHLARALAAPLPGDTGDRVRAVRLWDPLASSIAPTSSDDLAHWQQSLRSFASLGAFRTAAVNVAPAAGRALPADGAQLTAGVFRILGARPLLGRVLEAGDFAAGAPDVVVLGHGLWSARFGRDPSIVGRTVRIGRTLHVVVGVMPAGFSFPNSEALWTPLRSATVGGGGRAGERTRVQIVGRLADGATAADAQRELLSQGLPPLAGATSAREERERARLRPEVVPFGLLYLGLPAGGLASLPEFRFVQALTFALLLVACGNVAMLMFARTATRLRELAIRTALGASRGRIVSQIFVETLLLAVIAAAVGVIGFDWALRHVNLAGIAGASALPWWLSLGLTPQAWASALAFAAISATVAGALPAVSITGRDVARHIRGGTRVRFGRLTGALVVADIAVSVAAVGMALTVAGHATNLQAASRATGIPAAEYLGVEFRLPAGETPRTDAQRAEVQRRLVAALEREPGVRSVAAGDALPRMEHRSRPFELDGVERAPDDRLRWTHVARVDADYFRALDVRPLGGRDFASGDVAAANRRVAIVNAAFVARTLDGADPIGRRVRFPTQVDSGAAEWHEIVGVVGALGVNVVNPERGEAVYLPAAPGSLDPLQLAIHATQPPATLTARVREVATAVDPELVMGSATVLRDVRQGDWYLVMGVAAGLLVLVGVLLALATSGLYAMLSLAVTERTREIGIRAALGATRIGLLATLLRRSLVQIGVGAAIGLLLAGRFVFELTAESGGGGAVVRSAGIALGLALGVVLVVGVCSCLVPARRVLGVEASEAMRGEG